jgi:uncharacterized membrane protein YfcA
MDWTIYWFMFPVSICVATTAMLSGIGGAALFIPIFVIIFPILGPEYPLQTAAAIGTALMTEVFGFSSGFIGYHRKRLIDFKSAVPFLKWSVPVAVIGAVLLGYLHEQDSFLKGAYALLMIVLCPIILHHSVPAKTGLTPDASDKGEKEDREVRSITAQTGQTYTYNSPKVGALGGATTSTGAFLTGLLGVGIGEVIMPQLVKRNHFPVAVAAATSVFTVIVTIAAASFTQVTALIAAGGANAIPWNLVCYTIPAVILGGQIGPWLQGRIAQRTMEKAIGSLFGIIGVAMMWIVLR